MSLKTMLTATVLSLVSAQAADAQPAAADFIGKQTPVFQSDRMTPEALWAMGRIGGFNPSPDGKEAVYSVSYYSVKQNKSHSVLYTLNLLDGTSRQLTTSAKSEGGAVYVNEGKNIVFLSAESGSNQLWMMKADGTERRQISFADTDVADFLFSPDEKQVLLVMEVPQHHSVEAKEADLPLATGMVINDLMYKHWDTYVTSVPHPFVATFDGQTVKVGKDLLEGEPYECPMMPFGGVEQLAWSPDSKQVAYTCRKKVGKAYAISTDSDIFLYDLATGQVRNLCKPDGYVAPEVEADRSLQHQSVNSPATDCNMGYDQNPQFSPDGRYVAWSSMERDGYESDRTRLCVLDLQTGQKRYVTEQFESGVNEFCWAADSKQLYFTGVWHGKTQIYRTDLKGQHKPLTDDVADYSLLGLSADGKTLYTKRHSMSQADEVYALQLGKKQAEVRQLTCENEHFYDNLAFGKVEERWVKTADGKYMLCWVIYPPHFDPAKKYPALLFCEGGPQSPVSQFWSYRWNFQIMAANGYVIVAPNRRGLPGFGHEWNEAVSSDWTGQCMRDYLSAIDDAAENLPYVDRDRMGAVGASFGGFSVYYLAGHHDKRFKCFISHDGAFNLESMYTDTEEAWFSNWEYDDAFWNKKQTADARKTYDNSPHRFVDKWDTPILCIHGEMDYRINYNQGMGAFNAARMRGIPAELLIFPDENHWVLKPQNGVLWQRTFFNWLDRWLKK